LKAHIREAEKQLRERGYSKSANLLQPLQQFVENPSLSAGSHWQRAIFRSPSVFEQFSLTTVVQPTLTIGGSFSIRQFASELSLPRTFYVLALSKTRVDLLRCAGLHAEPAKLPPGVPATLEEAMAFDPPDHNLESRSAAGVSTGAMHSVRFGTGSGRERQHAHVADYYKLVDRGLRQMFRGPDIPLILAGVEEDVATYRGGSAYQGLTKSSILGSPDVARDQTELLLEAYSILHREEIERQLAALMAARERTGPSRFSTDPDNILPAAFEGRVDQLYLNESAKRMEMFERGTYHSWGEEDLLNVAAVQTIIHDGKACELPAEMVPDGAAVIGILRF
jgi:hypothetical protein